MNNSNNTLKCMNLQIWRPFTHKEMGEYIKGVRQDSEGQKHSVPRYESVLAVRQQLSTVDMYCYLKARFGEPNGIQSLLRENHSDNWIHWDFNLKSDGQNIWICGTSREIHFMISETLTDENWRDLIGQIKLDFGRMGKEKAAVLRSLEKWALFPNKFYELASVCSDLHGEIVDCVERYSPFPFPLLPSDESDRSLETFRSSSKQLVEDYSRLSRACLELSLITPILAEAFVNMVILMFCKKEIRSNVRQFDAFIRAQIDTKIFDLSYKCEGFAKKTDPNSPSYKNFKRVMDKRNHSVHGNIDPVREQTEVVYFEGKRPLFKESGDHIAKRFEIMVRQHEPDQIIKDYEDVHEFLLSIASCLEPAIKEQFWQIMDDPYPGYDLNRNIVGALLPVRTAVARMQGIRFDDELQVSWSNTTAEGEA